VREARAEAQVEQDARIAADQRAEQATKAQQSLEQQLAEYRELQSEYREMQQKMQAHLAGLSSLVHKGDTTILARKV
jgi:hypothetical protein